MTFVVFSLPRSRSAWLSTFLGGPGGPVGHDLGPQSDTPEDFLARLDAFGGSCETGAAFAWRLIRQYRPDTRFAVILRDPKEVCASLARFGLTGYEAEMTRRLRDLGEIGKLPGTFVLPYEALEREDACRSLYQHCRDEPIPERWWSRLADVNIQVDMDDQIHLLADRFDQIEALKAEVRRQTPKPGLVVDVEPWSLPLWGEIKALAEAHFEEVDGGVEPKRPFALDIGLMAALQGADSLVLMTARVDGALVGYFTWNVGPDVESEGLLIAQQGAWYVKPGFPKAAVGLFDRSVEVLRSRGVECIFPHHRVQGRGANIGRFFRRRGAKKIQETYCMWIGA